MRPMKTGNLMRIGVAVCVVALAITAAYFYGSTRANPAAALPAEITLGGASSTASVVPSTSTSAATSTTAAPTTATTQPSGTTPSATTASTQKTTPTGSSTSSGSSSQPSGHRSVVTTVWDWNCDNGNWGSGRGGW